MIEVAPDLPFSPAHEPAHDTRTARTWHAPFPPSPTSTACAVLLQVLPKVDAVDVGNLVFGRWCDRQRRLCLNSPFRLCYPRRTGIGKKKR